MLVVYCPFWFSIFLHSDNLGAAPIGGGTNWYGRDDAPFDIVLEGYFYFFLVWYWNRVMFNLGG